VMDNITWFHISCWLLITVITLFVLALLVIVVIKFNAKSNPVPSRTTHNTLIEWPGTLIPVLNPGRHRGAVVSDCCFRNSTFQGRPDHQRPPASSGTGSYAYPDNGKFEFDSLAAGQDKKPGRVLGSDNRDGGAG